MHWDAAVISRADALRFLRASCGSFLSFSFLSSRVASPAELLTVQVNIINYRVPKEKETVKASEHPHNPHFFFYKNR